MTVTKATNNFLNEKNKGFDASDCGANTCVIYCKKTSKEVMTIHWGTLRLDDNKEAWIATVTDAPASVMSMGCRLLRYLGANKIEPTF